MSNKHGFTDAELAMLDPKEREALDESDADEAKDEEKKEAAVDEKAQDAPGDQDDDDQDDADDDEGDEADANEGEEAKPPVEEPKEAAPARDTGDFVPSFQPRYTDEQKTKLADLDAKHEADEITTKEYLDQRDAIKDEAIRDSVAQERWEWEQERFMEDHPEYASKTRVAILDALVREVATEDGSKGKSGRWILTEAHRRVTEELGAPKGETKPPKPEAPAADAAKAGLKPSARRTDPATLPRTLSQAPAAGAEEVDQGEFADIDALVDRGDAIAAERRIASMSKADRERYERAH